MNEQESKQLRESIQQGLEISFDKMILEKKRTNSELAFADKGEIIKIKAIEL